MRVRCPECGASFAAAPARRVACPACGFAAHVPAQPPSPLSTGGAWTGLVLNALVPGLGSLHMGRWEGWAQLALLGLGIATIVNLVGFAFVASAWAWAVTQGVHQIQLVRARRTPASHAP